MTPPDIVLADLSPEELRAAAVDLCERGLLTCTRGQPGEEKATYAVAWAPLDCPESFPLEVRHRHEENMRRFREESESTHAHAAGSLTMALPGAMCAPLLRPLKRGEK